MSHAPRDPGDTAAPPAALALFHLGALGDLVIAVPAIRLLRRALGPRTRVHAFVSGRAKADLLVQAGAAHEGHDLSRVEYAPLFLSGAGTQEPTEPTTLLGTQELQDNYRKTAHPRGIVRSFSLAAVFMRGGDAVAEGLLRLGTQRVMVVSPRPIPEEDVHAADFVVAEVRRALGLAGAARPATPRLRVAAAERLAARATLRSLGIEPGSGLALHPGSGGSKKLWPIERFLELAREAPRRLGRAPLFLLGPVEMDAHPGLARAIEAEGRALVVEPSLAHLAALSSEAGLFLGNDGGPAHLAAAAGASTLALFGPSRAAVWTPRGRRAAALRAPGGDLEALDVDAVLRALREL